MDDDRNVSQGMGHIHRTIEVADNGVRAICWQRPRGSEQYAYAVSEACQLAEKIAPDEAGCARERDDPISHWSVVFCPTYPCAVCIAAKQRGQPPRMRQNHQLTKSALIRRSAELRRQPGQEREFRVSAGATHAQVDRSAIEFTKQRASFAGVQWRPAGRAPS